MSDSNLILVMSQEQHNGKKEQLFTPVFIQAKDVFGDGAEDQDPIPYWFFNFSFQLSCTLTFDEYTQKSIVLDNVSFLKFDDASRVPQGCYRKGDKLIDNLTKKDVEDTLASHFSNERYNNNADNDLRQDIRNWLNNNYALCIEKENINITPVTLSYIQKINIATNKLIKEAISEFINSLKSFPFETINKLFKDFRSAFFGFPFYKRLAIMVIGFMVLLSCIFGGISGGIYFRNLQNLKHEVEALATEVNQIRSLIPQDDSRQPINIKLQKLKRNLEEADNARNDKRWCQAKQMYNNVLEQYPPLKKMIELANLTEQEIRNAESFVKLGEKLCALNKEFTNCRNVYNKAQEEYNSGNFNRAFNLAKDKDKDLASRFIEILTKKHSEFVEKANWEFSQYNLKDAESLLEQIRLLEEAFPDWKDFSKLKKLLEDKRSKLDAMTKAYAAFNWDELIRVSDLILKECENHPEAKEMNQKASQLLSLTNDIVAYSENHDWLKVERLSAEIKNIHPDWSKDTRIAKAIQTAEKDKKSKLDAMTKAYAAFNWDETINVSSLILEKCPNHPKAKEMKEKASTLQKLTDAIVSSSGKHDWLEVERLSAVMKNIHPDWSKDTRIAKTIQTAEEISPHLKELERHYQCKDWLKVRDATYEVLKMDPLHPTAKNYFDESLGQLVDRLKRLQQEAQYGYQAQMWTRAVALSKEFFALYTHLSRHLPAEFQRMQQDMQFLNEMAEKQLMNGK